MSETMDYSAIGVRDPADTLVGFGPMQLRFLGSVGVAFVAGQVQVTVGGGAAIGVQQAGVPIVSTGTLNFLSGASIVNNAGTADITITSTPTSGSQVLLAGFTINPNANYIEVSAAGAVTSSAVTAISDGTINGQQLTLVNTSVNPITLFQTANVLCPNGVNYTMSQFDSISFVWSVAQSNWICTGSSVN